MNSHSNGIEKFISGELIDLCIPTEDFAFDSEWYSWFNDPSVTKYLEQGGFPNTRELQRQFFNSLGQDRLVLIIANKAGDNLGVISLSFINQAKRCCDIAIVTCGNGKPKDRPYVSLEAMALMTQHGFSMLGMKRINAGQHIDLRSWQQRLELLGFRIEGIHTQKFVKGDHVDDSMSISATYDDHIKLLAARGGKLWDAREKMRSRIKSLPRNSGCDRLQDFHRTVMNEYYENVFDL